MSNVSNESLLQYLKELNIINEAELQEAYIVAGSQKKDLRDVLLEKDAITDENLGKAVADLYNVPFVQLSKVVIPQEVLQIIPEVVARSQFIVAYKRDERGLHLATFDPYNLEAIDAVQKKVGTSVTVSYATKRDIIDALSSYSKEISTAFAQLLGEYIGQAHTLGEKDPPVIKVVDTLLEYGYRNRASDIHIEPMKDHTVVRFRIDGIMHDIVTLPSALHPSIVTRIKVQARLRTDEHLTAQDGKLQIAIGGDEVDIRVSIVPAARGEKVVLRLLSSLNRQFALEDLGLSREDLSKVVNAYRRPYGMILSTGPTGSGKTTTMYAILKLLNRREVNISTIEDPVEYEIEGVTHIQVNPKTNLTFAKGLKSILRQDPNIILVGEIRDEETANIALSAAMTGHLVLSTLHTNDAATAIPRLIEMKIPPYQIATTVNVIIAQRLLRKICQKCRVSIEYTRADLEKMLSAGLIQEFFSAEDRIRLYSGKGCQICHGSGYGGRIGVFEALIVTPAIRTAIVNKEEAEKIKEIAVKEGMTTMLKNGLLKVKQGATTLEEILRVTAE